MVPTQEKATPSPPRTLECVLVRHRNEAWVVRHPWTSERSEKPEEVRREDRSTAQGYNPSLDIRLLAIAGPAGVQAPRSQGGRF